LAQAKVNTVSISNAVSNSEKVQLVKVQEAQIGQRLDNFLIRRLKGVPKSRIYSLIRRGEVRVNKKRCKVERKLEVGDIVRIPPYTGAARPEIGKPSPVLQEYLLNAILYEDEDLLVIDKPAGFAVHGGSGIRLGLIEALRQCKAEWAELELAHRLDRATSGCLVIAKKAPFLKHIQQQLKERTVKKKYLALVHGTWPASLIQVEAALKKQALGENERIVRVDEMGKPSLTRFSVKQRFEGATLVEAMPETGRTHQIRVHCQHAGHAIVGDPKYTGKASSKDLSLVKNLCLHAWKIEFSKPNSPTMIKVQAEPDNHLQSMLSKLAKIQ